jgi:uncharacterized protein (TIGR02391 family)
MARVPSFSASVLDRLCAVIGDTATGLTGKEIGRLLVQHGLSDPGPITKKDRLYAALGEQQQRDGCANNVLAVVRSFLDPVNYLDKTEQFEERRGAVNGVLAFVGISVEPDGSLVSRPATTTLTEAERRARKLRNELVRRGAHAEVLLFCQAELVKENYFHAVLEASKSIAARLRGLTGSTLDGGRLLDQVLEPGTVGIPIVAFNSLTTETDRSEHRGLTLMIRGLFSAFRNPTAHEPKILRPINEQDATDLLTTVSLIHRALDRAVQTGRNT